MAQFSTVAAITGNGTVFAIDAQGKSRVLKVGDTLQKGETVRTVGDVRVELMMEDGRLLAVAPAQSVRLDENVVESDQRPTTQDSAVAAPATADTVIQALERGGDLSIELEATAAGLAPGGAVDGGNSFVQLLRIVEGVEPLNYNYTYTAPGPIQTVQALPELVPTTANGTPTAGNTTTAVDEDDIRSQESSLPSWTVAFESDVGSSPSFYNVPGVGDVVAAGDNLPALSPTMVTGLLNAGFGADGAGDIKFDVPTQALTSGGQALQYWVSADGHTVVGYVPVSSNEDSESSNVKVIFSAEITDTATGAYNFTLWGALDHPLTDDPATTFIKETAFEDNLNIVLGFTVTDSNGDTAAGSLTVNVDDDIPVVKAEGGSDTVVVDEDGLGNANVDGSPLRAGETDSTESLTATGSITDNVSWGADGFGHVTGVTVGATSGTAGTGSHDGGAPMATYTITNADYTLVAYEDGYYSITLNRAQSHTGSGEDLKALISSGFTVSAVDGDGDAVAGGVTVNVNVVDDIPVAPTLTANTAGAVTHDETAGLQNVTATPSPAGDANDNDVAGSTTITFHGASTTVAALFSSVTGGDDLDVAGTGPLGYAAGVASIVTLSGGSFGADGQASSGAASYAFKVTDGIASGVSTTGGTQIFLYDNGSGVILGRVGTEGGVTDTANSGGAVAFALTIDPITGKTYMVQYLSLAHPLGSVGNPDDTVFLSNSALQVTVTYTDGDGDKVTSDPVDVGSKISFEDDAPVSLTPNHIDIIDQATAPDVTTALNFVAGADGVQTVRFNITDDGLVAPPATELDGDPLSFNGQPLYLHYGQTGGVIDYTVLVATTSSALAPTGVSMTGANVAYWIDINPTANTYTMHSNGVISNGTETSATNLTGVGGGNVVWKGLVNIGGTNEDVLITTSAGDTINSNANQIGISEGNSFSAGEGIRFDFVNGLVAAKVGNDWTYQYDGTRNLTTAFRQEIDFLNGTDAKITVYAIVDDNLGPYNQTNVANFYGDSSGDTFAHIQLADVRVYYYTDPVAKTGLVDVTGSVVISGAGSHVDGFDSITITGLQQGYWFEIQSDTQFSAVQVDAIAGTSEFKLGEFSYGTASTGDPIDLSYNITGIDGDGDTVNGTINASLYPASVTYTDTVTGGHTLDHHTDTTTHYYLGNDGGDTLIAGSGDDVLMGGTGNDTMTGGLGVDTFKWSLGDQGPAGTPAVDTINDFGAGGADKLDLRDLLQGEHNGTSIDPNNLANYLHFNTTGGTTTVSVSSTGNVGVSHDQEIVLQGVNLNASNTISDVTVIANLLSANKLITDV